MGIKNLMVIRVFVELWLSSVDETVIKKKLHFYAHCGYMLLFFIEIFSKNLILYQ